MEREIKRRTPELTPRLALFGPPLLIEGEDAATYDELLARMLAAVKPADVIEEMLIADVAMLEWEVLRWHRLKTCLIRARGLAALEPFLRQNLDYDAYSDIFADHLTEILQENFPDNQAEDAQTLAHECARNEPDAVDKVNKILSGANLDMDRILDNAKRKSSCNHTCGTNQRPSRWSMSTSPVPARAWTPFWPMHLPRNLTISSGSIA
jgi:hypothetical protein